MKKLLLLFIFVIQSFAALSVEELTWDNGDTLLKFLQRKFHTYVALLWT